MKESSPSDISFRFFRLHRKVHPSFTFTQGGKILDIRHQKLASLWRHMKMKENGSPFLFMASFSSHKNISHPGTSVSVYADGRRVDCLSLQKNTIKLYSTPKGEVRVRVERGRAGIVESSCDHKICCLSPPVSLAGERIICAPNHFLIKINPSPFVDTSIG
ncbi:MAG: NusG domain II-containing protein [Candidatus Aminicenantes bacterium]